MEINMLADLSEMWKEFYRDMCRWFIGKTFLEFRQVTQLNLGSLSLVFALTMKNDLVRPYTN